MSEVDPDEEWTPPNDPGYSLEGPPATKGAVAFIVVIVLAFVVGFGTMIGLAISNRVAQDERYNQFVTYCEQELEGFVLDTGRWEAECVDPERRILDVWHA